MDFYVDRLIKLPKNQSFFLFGPRQVGKSTLIKSVFSEETTLFIDLLLSNEYYRYIKDPSLLKDEILSRQKKFTHIVIDEVQRVPELLNMVHYLIENDKSKPLFVLSGSSARKLKRGQANLLAGRALTLSLFPLNHLELKEHFYLNKILERGSLPAIYFETEENMFREKLLSYCKTYLEEEIRAEALVRQLPSFIKFLDLVSEENTNEINFSNISGDIGVSTGTIKEYFQILEDTLLGFFLYPYLKSSRKRLSKKPKFYFCDTGIQRALANQLSIKNFEGSAYYGKLFEHFIIKEIIQISKTLSQDFKFYFYRTSSGIEVDLIIESPSKGIFAIEIKAKDTNIEKKDLKGLLAFSEEEPEAKLFCCSLVPRRRTEGKIFIIPWQEVFKELGLESDANHQIPKTKCS